MRQKQSGIKATGRVGSSVLALAIVVLATFCAVPPAIPAAVPGSTLLSQSTVAPVTLTSAPTATSTATFIPTSVPTATVTATATRPFASATTLPVASPQTTTVSWSGATAKLDMDRIFPPGKGRDLVLFNCTGCHSFVRIVTGQRTQDAWQVVRRTMRSRVSGLGDQEYDELFAYLEANFDDTRPVPSLPDWLLGSY